MNESNRTRSRGLWVKLSVDYLDDPKILRAGVECEVLFIRGMAYAKKSGDGTIPEIALMRIGIALSDPYALAERLCEVGLWERDGDEYRIVGWGNWQTDQEAMDRRAEGGALGNHRRWHTGRTVPGCRYCDDDVIGERSVSDSVDRLPEKEIETEKERTNTLAGFDEFWSVYPRKVGKGDARKAWIASRRSRPAQEDLLSALRRAVEGWRGMEGRFIPHPATWIRQERWSDEDTTQQIAPAERVDSRLEGMKGTVIVFWRLRKPEEEIWDFINSQDSQYHDALHAFHDSLVDGSAGVSR